MANAGRSPRVGQSHGLRMRRNGAIQVMIKVLIGCVEPAWGIALRSEMAQEMEDASECSVRSLDRLIDGVAALRPDVLLLERSGDEGVGALVASVMRISPFTRVLLLCDGCSRELIMEALEWGASGCCFKSSPPAAFAQAVRAAHRGESWFSRTVLLDALGVRPIGRAAAAPTAEGKLTPREHEIMDLIGAGLTNKEIARRLAISDHTVKTHLHRVYVKLHRSGRYKALLAQPALAMETSVLAPAALPAASVRD
jgi:DNA-binding NarL/FixJ family response regulator